MSRRVWREKVVPLLWLYGVMLMIGAALGMSIAHAAPAASPGEQFAIDHAADICIALDARPSIPGVVSVLADLLKYGLSDRDAGVALGASVTFVCPIHDPLMRQFVSRFKAPTSAPAPARTPQVIA